MTADSLPVLTLGGYLGAGKTTLLNHLLRNADGRRLAVLVNEFGELPIDEDLIEAQDDELISIAGGCICCSFGNDLIGALNELSGMMPRPDYVIIESSGVAIPGAIVSTLSLLDGVHSDGIVVLADAETIQTAAKDDYIGDTITRQLSDAEIVVLTKMDLVDTAMAEEVEAWLGQTAPQAAIIPSQQGQVAPEALLGVVEKPGTGHDGPHADKLFDSMVIRPPDGTPPDALAKRLATGGFGIVRAKGHLPGPDGACWLVQTVGKRFEAVPSPQRFETGVVCLGLRGQLDRDAIARLIAETV
ncbi:MAG: GTP-binding protein [Paracoccaceae bacterium]